MEGAGILYDGDYVVIRSQQDATNGEIVAALVDGDEATVKQFERQGDTVVLRLGESGLSAHGFRGRRADHRQGRRRATSHSLTLGALPATRHQPCRSVSLM